MKKSDTDNTLLKSARMKKSWTPAFVSEKVGVSLHTYMRWETGIQVPRLSSLNALCKVFEMTPEELGFADLLLSKKENTAKDPTSKNSKRRPKISSSSTSTQAEQQTFPETLALWTVGITSCWEAYMGGGGQAELEQLLFTYLANLAKLTLYPGPDQKTAARLTAQVYQLIALLELQHGDFVAAQTNGVQAIIYSQLANDWNLYIATQIRLASIFMARKRIGSALSAYNDALRRINAHQDTVSPIVHSWIFAGLAEIQATMGREKEALQFLQLASVIFPKKPEEEACFSYTQCDRSMLFLYEGLVFLRLGQPKLAWDAFAQVDDLRPKPPERTRAEFLLQKAYTSFVLGNMVQSCIYLEAATKAAQAIHSDLSFSQAYTLYEHMLALWGQESRVRGLSRLFQK